MARQSGRRGEGFKEGRCDLHAWCAEEWRVASGVGLVIASVKRMSL